MFSTFEIEGDGTGLGLVEQFDDEFSNEYPIHLGIWKISEKKREWSCKYRFGMNEADEAAHFLRKNKELEIVINGVEMDRDKFLSGFFPF